MINFQLPLKMYKRFALNVCTGTSGTGIDILVNHAKWPNKTDTPDRKNLRGLS